MNSRSSIQTNHGHLGLKNEAKAETGPQKAGGCSKQDRVQLKKEATRHMPAGATSTGVGEPLPGAEKKEATTRHRPAGATSTGDGEPLP